MSGKPEPYRPTNREVLIAALNAYASAETEVWALMDAYDALLVDIASADKEASAAHDAIHAEPFDQKAASDAIWRIHNILRPLAAGGAEGDTR